MRERFARAVAESGWEALVALGPENVQYLSGVWRSTARGYLDRPHIVVWPADADPVRIGGAETIDAVRPGSLIDQFVGYQEMGARPPAVIVDTLATVLKRAGLERGTIGLEMLRTSAPFYARLCELMPAVRFEPADDFLHGLRMVKTPEEIERMKRGAAYTDQGVANGISNAIAGETERQLAAHLQLGILATGCDAVTVCLVGTGERARTLGSPSDRVMTNGDVVRIDVNSIYEGYFLDMGRMAFVGEPTAEYAQAYRLQLELGARVREYVRPGRKCSEVHAFYIGEAERMGVELFIYPYIGLGHGIGVNADEYPKLNAEDHTLIEPGMILNIEPDTYGPEGEIFHMEDMLLVTDDGNVPLTHSRDWSEPMIVTVL